MGCSSQKNLNKPFQDGGTPRFQDGGQTSVVAGVFSHHFVRPMRRFGNTIYSHGLIKVYNRNIMSDLRIGSGEQNESKSGVKSK